MLTVYRATRTFENGATATSIVQGPEADAARAIGYSLVELVPADRIAELEADYSALEADYSALAADYSALEADYSALMQKHNALHMNAHELRAECARLRKDADRYRWIVAQSWFQSAFDRFDFDDRGQQHLFEECAAKIIDAALAAKGGEHAAD